MPEISGRTVGTDREGPNRSMNGSDWKEGQFLEEILQASERLGIGLSRDQAWLCCRHISLMLEWNRRLNLTRITDPREILEKHILDSLLPARHLPRAGLALDIGSGGGFPGIPLKILHPGLDMVLLDSNRKKASFLQVVVATLGLQHARAVQGRWEEMEKLPMPAGPAGFELVTMRAVRLEPASLKLAERSLKPGGLFAWWAGPGSESAGDVFAARPDSAGLAFEGVFPYELPSASRPRQLLLWRRTAGP